MILLFHSIHFTSPINSLTPHIAPLHIPHQTYKLTKTPLIFPAHPKTKAPISSSYNVPSFYRKTPRSGQKNARWHFVTRINHHKNWKGKLVFPYTTLLHYYIIVFSVSESATISATKFIELYSVPEKMAFHSLTLSPQSIRSSPSLPSTAKQQIFLCYSSSTTCFTSNKNAVVRPSSSISRRRDCKVRSSLDTAGPTVGQVTEVNKDTFWPIVKAAADKTVVLDMYTQW